MPMLLAAMFFLQGFKEMRKDKKYKDVDNFPLSQF